MTERIIQPTERHAGMMELTVEGRSFQIYGCTDEALNVLSTHVASVMQDKRYVEELAR